MRILKITLIALLGLTILLLLSVVAITATIDPNDYKTDIESAVAENTTLALTIDGNLGWSFIPLGVDINNVSLDHLDGKPFTKLNQLTAQVGLLSLLKFNPQVHKIILDGLDITLEKNEQGEASWENITPEKVTTNQNNSTSKSAPSSTTNESATFQNTGLGNPQSNTLQLEIEEIAITNTTIRYIDKQSGQSASLEDFNLLANNISLGSEFPLDINFKVSSSSPKIDLTAQINAALVIDSSMKQFTVRRLQSNYTLSGAPFEEKEVSASANSDSIVADLTKDTLNLDKLALEFADLNLNANIDIQNLSTDPKLDGSLTILPFSLQSLLTSVGQPTIKTTDSEALKKLSFGTKLSGSTEELTLNSLVIQLDDTRYEGSLNYRADGQYVSANIRGTELNIDRYLPPTKDPITEASNKIANNSSGTKESGSSKAVKSNQPEPQLLPLDIIRALNLDISFIQQKLIAKNLKFNDLTLAMTARNGVITLSEASGKLYEGEFNANVKIDASSDTPSWTIEKVINNIQVMPLLKDLQDLEIVSGGINLKADIKTSGNTVSALRKAAKGNAKFNFDKGALHGFNLTKLTCEGVALINKDKIAKTDWSDKSEFQAMTGSIDINGNEFVNNNLTAAMSGIALLGKGIIDAETLSIDYGIDLKAIGDLGDNACRVNEKVKDLAIPVICKGSLNADPAKLCKVDYSRIQDLILALSKKELERKADKEIDKQLDKYLGDDESGTKKDVKKLLKGLF